MSAQWKEGKGEEEERHLHALPLFGEYSGLMGVFSGWRLFYSVGRGKDHAGTSGVDERPLRHGDGLAYGQVLQVPEVPPACRG